jgi:biopolymer transport protein ExbB
MTGKIIISIFDSIPLWVMILPIGICSIIALAVIIERSLFYRSISADYRHLMSKLTTPLKNGDRAEARSFLNRYSGKIAVMIENIMERSADKSEKDIIVRDEAEKTVRYIEKFGATISTIATISPMLGLLGTVTGMMKSFSGLATFGPSAQDLLAQGITEALITTALGLMVAIPSMIFYNYMATKTDIFIREIEFISNSFIDLWGPEKSHQE